jgi:hypothetical protein
MSAGRVVAALVMGLGGGLCGGACIERKRAARAARVPPPNQGLSVAVPQGQAPLLAQASGDFRTAEARVEEQLRAGNWMQAALDLVSMAKALARVQERSLAVHGTISQDILGDMRNRMDARMRQVGARSLTPPNVYGLTEGGEP